MPESSVTGKGLKVLGSYGFGRLGLVFRIWGFRGAGPRQVNVETVLMMTPLCYRGQCQADPHGAAGD